MPERSQDPVAALGFRTLAVLSSKGGSGKTTVAVHMAVAGAACGLRPVLLDCDPQRSASDWAAQRRAPQPQVVRAQPEMLAGLHAGLMRSDAKLLVLDTPPSGGPEIVEALRLADLALIVCRPTALDVWGVSRAAELAKKVCQRAEFVINQAPSRRGGVEAPAVLEAAAALRVYGLPVAPIGLRTRVDFSNAVKTGLSAPEYAPNGTAAAEIGRLWSHVDELLWAGRASKYKTSSAKKRDR